MEAAACAVRRTGRGGALELWGLTAQLGRAAEARAENDDAQRDYLAVANALGDLLASLQNAGPATAHLSNQRSGLAMLAERFLADRDVANALGQPDWDIAQAPDAKLGRSSSQAFCGSMPVPRRDGARAIESVREAGLAQLTPVLVLPLEPWPPADADGVLGPDLSSETVADARKPIASGIRFDSNAPFDCRFAPPASCAPELALLARIAASYTAPRKSMAVSGTPQLGRRFLERFRLRNERST